MLCSAVAAAYSTPVSRKCLGTSQTYCCIITSEVRSFNQMISQYPHRLCGHASSQRHLANDAWARLRLLLLVVVVLLL
jgi:hypothetical protein